MQQQKIEDVICFTVPLMVPSVNHYKEPCKYIGKSGYLRTGFRLSKETRAFYDAVAIFAQNRTVSPQTPAERKKAKYTVDVNVWFGPKTRADADNLGKALCDSLVRCGMIHSDANVVSFNVTTHKDDRDNPANPRTEFLVTRMEEQRG